MSAEVQTPPLILIAGPTATGKTALAVEIALRLDGELISADSMQIYRGCVIGTAQPLADELRGVRGHLIGCLEPHQPWSVADWLRETWRLIPEIHGRGKAAIVVGGTGLYFKALTDGLFENPGAGRHEEIRRRLEAEWNADAGKALHARLDKIDPEAAARIHPNDRLRIVRALEVFEVTGSPVSFLREEARKRHETIHAHRFVLSGQREDLYRRIDARVLSMMQKGFVDEVRDLVAQGGNEQWPSMRAIGYRQVLEMIREEKTYDQAVEETQRLSRRYAKQQMVLYRNWPGSIWLDTMAGIEKNATNVQIVLEF